MKKTSKVFQLVAVGAFLTSMTIFGFVNSSYGEEGGPYKHEKIIEDECQFSWCLWRECKVGNDGAYCLEDTPCYDPDTSLPCIWDPN